MSDISKLNVNGNDYDIKDEAARAAIQNELAGLPVDEKVEIIKNRLNNALADTNAALVAKGVMEVTKFDEVPVAIKNLPERKEEQEKSITIADNGTAEVIPDEGKTLSKVIVNVEVDQSGGAQGIILSGFTGSYKQPTVADLRSLEITDSANKYNLNLLNNCFSNTTANANGGYYIQLKEVYLPQNLEQIYSSMFSYCSNLTTLHGDVTKVKRIQSYAFRGCKSIIDFPQFPNLATIDKQAFVGCTGLTVVKFYSVVSSLANDAFNSSTNLLDIYVPWAEGAVENAPWGATNATIHYNTTYDENGNPIVSEV